MLEKRAISNRIRLRIYKMRNILDKLEKINNTFGKHRITSSDFYVVKIDKETRRLLSCCNAIMILNNIGRDE